MLYESIAPAGVLSTAVAGPPIDEFPMTQVWLAVSTDGGLTWSNQPVLDTTALPGPLQNGTVAHLLVASAIDPSGNLYAAFSLRREGATTTQIYVVHSTDHGITWSSPAVIAAPTLSNVMPALAVSSSGVAYLCWYGSPDPDFRDAAATWAEMAATVSDPLSPQPSSTVAQVSGAQPVHVGGIDTAGTIGADLGDNWGLRDLQSLALDQCGRPHPVWAVDVGTPKTQTATPATACQRR